MGLLDTAMQNDAAQMVNDDVFGESVTFTTIAGVATAYKAVVDRRQPGPVDGQAQGVAPDLVISFVRDPNGTNGPSAVKAGDRVTVAERIGESTRVLTVTEVAENDTGMWVLRCR